MKSDCYVESGVPVIRGNNITAGRRFTADFVYISIQKAEELKGCIVKEGDLVFPHRGAIGEVGIVGKDQKFVISSSLMKFTPNLAIVSSSFLFYFFRSREGKGKLLENASQVGTPGIGQPLTSLKSISVVLPPLSEQKAIAAVLGSLDDKIELLREQNETLEALAQTLFKRWFIDFNFPDENGNPYKDSGGAMIASELGEIPEGWKADNLNDYISISGGGTPSTKESSYWDGDIAWSSPKDLSDRPDPFLFETNKTITNEGFDAISSGLNPVGSLLLSSRAPIGYIAFVDVPVAVNQGYIVFATEQRLSNQFMFLWLKKHMTVVTNAANGSTFLEISKKVFKEIETVIPSEGALRDFKNLVTPQFEKLRNNLIQIKTLTQLRDTLLPKLMKGEIRVTS